MRILSRKNHVRDKHAPEPVEETPATEPAAAPVATAPEDTPAPAAPETEAAAVEKPVQEAPSPDAPATESAGDAAVTADAPAPAESAPATPVEDELAQVEEEAAAEESEIRLKAADLLAPDRRDFLMPVPEPDPTPVDMAEVISFANQKGGVAKTTSTLNLAVALSELGNRVLCIDLDPQGNLTMSQGIDPDKVEHSMYDVLVDDLPISEVIAHREIDIAVASIDLAGAEIAMSTKIGRERSLEKALREVHADYDYICIDTPPSLGLLTINALTASSKVIVPVQCEYLSMRGLVQLQNTLKMIQENLNPNVRIEGILPTMFDARTLHAREAVSILEENFGDLVFKSRIRKAVKFAEAPVRGASVLKYDSDSRAASYYRNLAKEVLSDGSS
ncbi:MAG: AAA family ATPase [Actinomycetota bacterium]|nr:AAA family ATPase [Actinomycetota bacterium]